MKEYIKYVFWLEPAVFHNLEKAVALREAKKAVCVPLARDASPGFVPPDAWGRYEICRRQMSWVARSRFAGKTLVVASQDLKEFGLVPETIIRQTDFKAPALPGEDEKQAMIARRSYQEARPPEWEDILGKDAAEAGRWLRIMGVRGIAFERLFVTHCANHANFMEPAYYVEENGEKVPYSIAKTNHVCSACMELYNVIGGKFKKKLVMPCPGSVLFAGLSVNRYLEAAKP